MAAAYAITEGGQIAFPVVIGGFSGMRSGMAFRLADERVYDPIWNKTFTNSKLWREAFEAETPYEPGKVPGVSGKDGKTPETMKRSAEPAAGPANKYPTTPAPAGLVKFGDKTYKTASFWRYTGEGYDFLFEIPGDSVYPKDPMAKKITRDEFFKLRKEELPVRTVNPDDELELPFGGEDDDDGMEMV